MTDPVGNSYPESSLGSAVQLVEDAIADLQTHRTVERIWERDHTVWRPEPTEITNRLGWLDVSDVMREQVPGLEAFAREVLDAGFLHVALLLPACCSVCDIQTIVGHRNRKRHARIINKCDPCVKALRPSQHLEIPSESV